MAMLVCEMVVGQNIAYKIYLLKQSSILDADLLEKSQIFPFVQ